MTEGLMSLMRAARQPTSGISDGVPKRRSLGLFKKVAPQPPLRLVRCSSRKYPERRDVELRDRYGLGIEARTLIQAYRDARVRSGGVSGFTPLLQFVGTEVPDVSTSIYPEHAASSCYGFDSCLRKQDGRCSHFWLEST